MSNKLYEENDIQNIANAIRNKNGTEDTYKVSQMSTAIDSIEVIEQATVEGESLSLTNTKAMPYSDYVVEGKSTQSGEPSPSNPSEIHSVADDVNLFDVTNKTATLGGASYTAKNGEIIINGQSTQNASIAVGKVYLKANTNYYFSYNNNNSLNSSYFVFNDHGTNIFLNQDRTFTVSQDGEYEPGFILISGTYSNLIIRPKIQKGTASTPYSPYNQGTVTIKQRGKNLAQITNCNIIESDKTVEVINGIVKIQATSSNFNIDLSGGLITGMWAQSYSDATDYNLTEENLKTYIFKVWFNKISGIGTSNNFIQIITNQRTYNLYVKPQTIFSYLTQIITLQEAEHIKQIAYWNNGSNSNVDIEFYCQLEERNTSNRLRTISNTTRLHYTNRTIT